MDTPNLDDLAQILLLNIIYRMTSIKDYKHELDQNQAFLKKLKDLNSQSMQNIYLPKHTEKLQVAVNGILRNLGKMERISDALPQLVFPDYSTSLTKKVLVSYQGENRGFCKALVDKLKKSKIDVWVAYERLEEADSSQHHLIAEAMEAADRMICILTKDYFASAECQWELEYAINRQKTTKNYIIPIRVGNKYIPPLQYRYRFSDILFIRFSEYPGFDSKIGPPDDDPSFEERIQTLRNRILRNVKEKKPTNVIDDEENNNNEIPVTAPTIPLHEWKEEDIAQWLASIPVSRELTDLYNFQSLEELLAYARDLKEHEDINYIDIKEVFNNKYGCILQRKDFLTLRNGFDQLMENNPTTNDLKTQTITRDETDPVKSKTCALM